MIILVIMLFSYIKFFKNHKFNTIIYQPNLFEQAMCDVNILNAFPTISDPDFKHHYIFTIDDMFMFTGSLNMSKNCSSFKKYLDFKTLDYYTICYIFNQYINIMFKRRLNSNRLQVITKIRKILNVCMNRIDNEQEIECVMCLESDNKKMTFTTCCLIAVCIDCLRLNIGLNYIIKKTGESFYLKGVYSPCCRTSLYVPDYYLTTPIINKSNKFRILMSCIEQYKNVIVYNSHIPEMFILKVFGRSNVMYITDLEPNQEEIGPILMLTNYHDIRSIKNMQQLSKMKCIIIVKTSREHEENILKNIMKNTSIERNIKSYIIQMCE